MKKTNQTLDQRKQSLLAEMKLLEENESRVREILEKVLPKARAEILSALATLDSLKTDDDYSTSYVELIKGCGESGVRLSDLRSVLPDADKLAAVRKQFGPEGEGIIREKEAKQTWQLYYNGNPSHEAQGATPIETESVEAPATAVPAARAELVPA